MLAGSKTLRHATPRDDARETKTDALLRCYLLRKTHQYFSAGLSLWPLPDFFLLAGILPLVTGAVSTHTTHPGIQTTVSGSARGVECSLFYSYGHQNRPAFSSGGVKITAGAIVTTKPSRNKPSVTGGKPPTGPCFVDHPLRSRINRRSSCPALRGSRAAGASVASCACFWRTRRRGGFCASRSPVPALWPFVTD